MIDPKSQQKALERASILPSHTEQGDEHNATANNGDRPSEMRCKGSESNPPNPRATSANEHLREANEGYGPLGTRGEYSREGANGKGRNNGSPYLAMISSTTDNVEPTAANNEQGGHPTTRRQQNRGGERSGNDRGRINRSMLRQPRIRNGNECGNDVTSPTAANNEQVGRGQRRFRQTRVTNNNSEIDLLWGDDPLASEKKGAD